MDRTALVTVIGLLIANVLWIVWYGPAEGWHIVWFPLLSLYLAWRAIGSSHRIAALRNDVAIFRRTNRGFHVDLAHPHRASDSLSPSGVLRALGLLVGVATGLVLYVFLFVRLGRLLQLEPDVAYSIGAGCFLLLIAALGMSPIMADRRGLAPVAVYVALVGLYFLGRGVYTQYDSAQARARCARALAGANVHQRLRILSTTTSCRGR